MTEIIHFAGPTLRIGDVIRQRCLWCGGLIDERDATKMAVLVELGEDPEVVVAATFSSHWTGLVAVDGHARWHVDEPVDGKVPERACSELLPS